MTGPLAPFAVAYGLELKKRGYTPLTRMNQLRQVGRLSRWLQVSGLTVTQLSAECVEEFLAYQHTEGRYRAQWSRPGLRCLLDVLGELGVATEEPARIGSPEDTLLGSFAATGGRCSWWPGRREVFLVARAPFAPVSAGTVSSTVRRACRRAGVPEVGAHRLRHTVACGMVSAGVPLTQIAQVLRHHSLQTTAVYARVDRRGLRLLAAPWPQAAPWRSRPSGKQRTSPRAKISSTPGRSSRTRRSGADHEQAEAWVYDEPASGPRQ